MTSMRSARASDDREAVGTEFEGEIRDIVRRDLAAGRAHVDNEEAGIGNLSAVIERVAASSATQIEKLISELQILRDFLYNEGQRVQREIAGYAQLSQTAMNSTKVITDSLSQWHGAVEAKRTIDNQD